MPAAILASLLVTMVFEMAYTFHWWTVKEYILPWGAHHKHTSDLWCIYTGNNMDLSFFLRKVFLDLHDHQCNSRCLLCIHSS